MAIRLGIPDSEGMLEVLAALGEWQSDAVPFQLHPGDLGWFERFGATRTRAAVRTWSRDGRIIAIGLLDGPDLFRLTMEPALAQDDELARQLLDDLSDPDRGVLPAGNAYLESPTGVRVRELLANAGWQTDAPWTPLTRDLREPVESHGLRIEVVGSELAEVRVGLQRASFDSSTFTTDAWHAMAAGPAFAAARDLLGFDESGNAVAAITVWSAGPGRPGLIEPMGIHRDYRGRGYGTAITLAGAAALRELGSSSVVVCTRTAKVGAIATYESAGMRRRTERLDQSRGAQAPA